MVATQEHVVQRVWSLRGLLWASIAFLPCMPLLAMRFTHEVAWDVADVLAAALLLTGVGVGLELAVRLVARGVSRGLAVGTVILCGVMVWADAAVGIF